MRARRQRMRRCAVDTGPAPVTSPVAALEARIVELEEEVHRLKKAEDEGGITLSRHDTSADSVKAIRDMYRSQAAKLRTLAHGLLREADGIEGKAERPKRNSGFPPFATNERRILRRASSSHACEHGIRANAHA
jgi:hypothetical protein